MNKNAKRYLIEAKRNLCCSLGEKKVFLSQIETSLNEYCLAHPDCSYEDILLSFGSADDFVRPFMQSISIDKIKTAVKIKKAVSVVSIAVTLFCSVFSVKIAFEPKKPSFIKSQAKAISCNCAIAREKENLRRHLDSIQGKEKNPEDLDFDVTTIEADDCQAKNAVMSTVDFGDYIVSKSEDTCSIDFKNPSKITPEKRTEIYKSLGFPEEVINALVGTY